MTKNLPAPAGATSGIALDKNIPRVVLSSVLLQKGNYFLLKADFAMMLFLIPDVALHLLHVRFANAERRIPGLPAEIAPVRPVVLYPARGMGFNLFHDQGDRERPWLDKQHVDMIRWAIH